MLVTAKISCVFHNCNGFYTRFPEGIALRTLLFGRIFAKFEDLGVVHVGDQFLRLFAELVNLLRLAQVLKEGFLVLVVLELLDQLLDLVVTCCILLFNCRKWYAIRCYRFPCNFSNRLMVPKMILRLGFADLVDHMAILELSEPFGKAPPSFSYIPLCQCNLQVVCCRERLHVTVSGKIASFSRERASNCTKTLHFERISKYPCMERSLVSSSHVEFPPFYIHPPSGLLS